MVNYTDAFKRPFQDIKKLAIGAALSILPIINFIAIGYILENAKSAMKKNYKLTEWGNWADLFVRGLLFVVISFVYAIPALVVFLATVGTAFVRSMGGMNPLALATNIASLGAGIVLFFILALVAAYFIPAAALNYVTKDKFAAAFNFAEVKNKALRGEYFAAWIVGIVYTVILVLILSWLPFVGAGIATFIAMMTTYTLIAEAFASK